MDAQATKTTTSTGIFGETQEASKGSSTKDEDSTDPMSDGGMSLDSFLIHFLRNHRDDNFLSVKHGNYTVTSEEAIGEIVDWTMQYLQYMSCPAHLEAGLTRAVLDEARANYLNHNTTSMSPTGTGDADGEKNEKCASSEDLQPAHPSLTSSATKGSQVFQSMKLLQNVTSTVHQVCRRLKMDEYKSNASTLNQKIKPGRLTPNSVHAVKNGRRKMEDRHVVIHDLNMIYADSNNDMSGGRLQNEPPLSFYGVYDGHAGKDAAAFTASHLHGHILESPYYPSDPVLAIKDAFNKTDHVFLEKGQKEPLKSGTTAVCSLIRGNTLYSAWLGDSQAVLVRNGYPVKVVEPHKPNRPDEKKRIEELGGTVIHWGTWRVNGQLAVSRAIGDGDYKPYVSSDPDITTVEMNGTEDFIIIACDGLWDTVTPMSATNCIYKQLQTDKDNLDSISQQLVILAKDNGSTDNITVVVVFLKPIEDILQKVRTQYHHLKDCEKLDNYDTIDCGGSFTYTKVPGLQLYEGITSTSTFVTDDNMNGDSTENLTNGDDIHHHLDDTPSPGIKANSNNPFSTMIDLGLNDKQFQGDSSSDCGNNPFSSPGAQAFGGGFGDVVNPFSDMSGGDAMGGFEDGRMGTHSSSEGGDDSLDGSCNDVMISQQGGLLNLSGEEFNQASPSMFEESKSPSMFIKPSVEPITPSLNSNDEEEALMNNDEFVANSAHSWISSPNSNASTDDNAAQNISTMAATGIGANPLTNPFLSHNKCGDSGFISPAGNSQHQSASSSSEDSAENREERESVERASSVGSDRHSDVASVASVHEHISAEKRESVSSDKDKEGNVDVEDSDDEEAKEHQEVTKLLSGGGMMDHQLGDLMASVNRDTPTPPVEENGSTLEEILAAARNQPDEPGLVEDVDSDETSSDADEELVEQNISSRKSSQLSQQFEATENFEQSPGVVECEDVDSSNESSSDADDDGFTFVKKEGESILNTFPRSTSPLVIVTEGEYLHGTDLESLENFDEKPEIILKSALVNPNIDLYQQNDVIDEIESGDTLHELSAQTFTNEENNLENLEKDIPQVQIKIEEFITTEQVTENVEVLDNQVNQLTEEKETTDVEFEVKDNIISYTEEAHTSKVESSETVFVQSANPLQVSPAVNTLNALEDYMNQDIADAESSSAPSSLESQSGPASVIIESQEVPIPDQASFIIKPTESHQLNLPSPQEAVIEVIPEEHFRERSQSPILEENEDMSDSESKSPISHVNGNAFELIEDTNTEIIGRDVQAVKAAEPHISSNDIEVNSNALNDDIITNKTEPVLMDIVESEVAEANISANDIKEQISVVENLDVSNTVDAVVEEDNVSKQADANDEDKKSFVNDDAEAKVEVNVLQPNDEGPSDQLKNNEEDCKEVAIEAKAEILDSEAVNSDLIEVEPPTHSTTQNPVPEQNMDETLKEKAEISSMVPDLKITCNEIPLEEEKAHDNQCDEPATAEVTEGKIGFYTEKDSPIESNVLELKDELLEEKEEPQQVIADKVEQHEQDNIKLSAEETHTMREPIVTDAPVPEPTIQTENVIERKESDVKLPLEDAVNENSLMAAPEVNLTPATPVPEVCDEVEMPLEKEVKAQVEGNVTADEVKVPHPIEEVKQPKKNEDKKVLQEKATSSPIHKRSTKPVAAKSTGISSNKPTGSSATSPKPRVKATPSKPLPTTGTRVNSSSTASKVQTPGSSTLSSRRPASGSSLASKGSSAGTNVAAKSASTAKPPPRSTPTRTPTTTATRSPLATRTSAAKPKATGTAANSLGTKSTSPTARPMVPRTPVAKPKVDETKKTAASSVSARSTLTRTTSPASGPRSRTPVSPKTTTPRTTRPITTTASSRSTVTTTTSRASTKPATATSTVAAARKAPTPRTAPVKSTTTAASTRTTASRTTTSSTRTTLSSSSPAKTKPAVTDISRRPLVPSGPRPTDLTKKRIPSAKDKQQSNSTKSNPSKSKGTGLPDGSGLEKNSSNSQNKVNGGSSSPDEVGQLINGANGDDGNIGSGQIPGTPVDSSGAASPIIGEPGHSSLANGSL